MKRTLTILTAAIFTVFFAGRASAQPKVEPPTPLGACTKACEASLLNVCLDENNRHLPTLCSGVPECQKLSPADVNTATHMLKLCYDGVMKNCPRGCGNATTIAPPPKTGGGTATQQRRRRPPPPKTKDECAASGGFYLETVNPNDANKTIRQCFTHQGIYDLIQGVSSRVKKLENADKDAPETKLEQDKLDSLLREIKKSVGETNQELKNFITYVEETLVKVSEKIDGLQRDVDSANEKSDKANEKSDEALAAARRAEQRRTASFKPALFGLSVAPQFTLQLRKTWHETQYAGGVDFGLYPSLSTNGRHRIAINLGIGKAGDYFNQGMVQHHVFGGYGYFGPAGSVSVGLGVNRYSLTDVQQGRLFWGGAMLEGRVNVADLDYQGSQSSEVRSDTQAEPRIHGSQLFVGAAAGIGKTYYRHGQLDPRYEPVRDHWDVPIFFKIGWQKVPFL